MGAVTLPPVDLVCVSLLAARVSHRRLAHNALAVALLGSRNAPVMHAPPQVPNGLRRGDTSGGFEVLALEQLQATVDHLEAAHAIAMPGSVERAKLADRMDRADAMMLKVRGALSDMPTPSVPAGMRDTYTVTVPGLHARVIGLKDQTVDYTADLMRAQIAVDPGTPRYDEYLGRHAWPGHQATGPQPLYKVRSDHSGLTLATEARDWHETLIAHLWPAPRLPELLAVLENVTETL